MRNLIRNLPILYSLVWISLNLSACQHIQIAGSPIPVTADKKTPPVQQAQVDRRN
ncbi:hypothetical protein [Psychrobacter lutiphocae]|uniref:hypothetical protein n=1 Tax=Psychrobacter lutiphocae TaxID=540500 RepID=UPI00037E49BB|nr:hypothetical protein [Psychrobacter lutiphocae]